MRAVTQTRQLDAADPNGIFLDQTTGGAGNLVLNGAFVVNGVAVLDQQRRVELESAANLSAINFTITGTDEQGRPISETIIGPNAGVQATTIDFLTVTQIAVDAAVGTNVEGGTNGVGGSEPIPLDQYISPFNVSLAVVVTGVINYTVQFTFDDVFEEVNAAPFVWFDHTDLTSLAIDGQATLISNVKAVRLLTNSGVGTGRFETQQAGLT